MEDPNLIYHYFSKYISFQMMDLNSPNTNEADLKIIFQNFLLLNWKILLQKRAWRPRPPIPPDLWDVDNNSQSKLPSQEKV